MSIEDGPGAAPTGPSPDAPTPPWPEASLAPTAPPTDATIGLTRDIVKVRERALATDSRIDTIHRTLTGMAATLLVIVVVFGYLIYRQSERIADVDAARVSDTSQQLITQANLRTALCATGPAILGGDTAAARATWPAGPAAYDRMTQALRTAASALRCPD